MQYNNVVQVGIIETFGTNTATRRINIMIVPNFIIPIDLFFFSGEKKKKMQYK